MITMKDPTLTVYPDREQMLALIQARAAASATARPDERASAASETEPLYPTCVFYVDL